MYFFTAKQKNLVAQIKDRAVRYFIFYFRRFRLSVRFLAVFYAHDFDGDHFVVDFVKDTIVADSDPPSIFRT